MVLFPHNVVTLSGRQDPTLRFTCLFITQLLGWGQGFTAHPLPTTSTLDELHNWFENIQKFNTKCSFRGNISDTVPLSKPVLEITNCGGLNDISNYDFKVFLTFTISNNIQKYTYYITYYLVT